MSNEKFVPEELRLARQVLALSRKRITAAAPWMLVPIYALLDRPRPEPGPLSTDGVFAWFCPGQVLKDFRADHDEPARQLLHITLHCLLGHLTGRQEARFKPTFDVLADKKAAMFAREIAGFACSVPVEEFLPYAIDPLLTPVSMQRPLPALYRTLCEKENRKSMKKVLQTAEKYRVDDHALWAKASPPGPAAAAEGGSGGSGERGSGNKTAAGDGQADSPERSRPDWQSMLRDLSSGMGGKLPGNLPGMLQMEVQPAEENGISYAAFLKRFAVPRERLLLDPDSFDPRWYHLGLELYGDIPLLEPSELSEPPLPDDLVIALDTSGSCSGDVCRRFLRETLNLLEDITCGASSFHILALQCDTRIQAELMLESPDQVERFLEDFTPRGFGGTDFRPVFQRVEELRRSGELPRLRGLLYLSDAFGDFPDNAPDYPVAFLIPSEEGGFCQPDIPEWVTALYLNADDYTVKEAAT